MGYYGLTETDCVIILLVYPIGYGLYINLKKAFADLPIIPFLIVFCLSRTLAGLIIYSICGFPTVDTGVSGWDEFLYLFMVFIAGSILGPGEYMLFTSARHLHSSTVSSMLNSQYILGAIIFYLMSPDSVNVYYLLVGLLLATLGSMAIIASEFLREVNDFESLFTPATDGETESLLSVKPPPPPPPPNRRSTAFWLFIATCASMGLLICNTLVVSEESFTDGISDPGIIAVVFLSGSVLGIVLVLILFGWLDILNEQNYPGKNALVEALQELRDSPLSKVLWTVAIGMLTACADTAVFVGFSELPYSISYALGMLEVVIGAGTAVLFFGDYKHLTSYFAPPILLVYLGTALFVVAIYVYYMYAF